MALEGDPVYQALLAAMDDAGDTAPIERSFLADATSLIQTVVADDDQLDEHGDAEEVRMPTPSPPATPMIAVDPDDRGVGREIVVVPDGVAPAQMLCLTEPEPEPVGLPVDGTMPERCFRVSLTRYQPCISGCLGSGAAGCISYRDQRTWTMQQRRRGKRVSDSSCGRRSVG
jgi:hypothetical protein